MSAPDDIVRLIRLVLRAQSGERAAWDELLLATQGWLHAYFVRLAGNREQADDLL